MFKSACGHDDEVVFYFDGLGNKYVAEGGTFAWRLNNPVLVRSTCYFARRNGSIGSYKGFAIFSYPEQGRKAFEDLLKSKKYCNSKLIAIAKLYEPKNPEQFLFSLYSSASLDHNKKLCCFSKEELFRLKRTIEKLCGYSFLGNEKFILLPKIYAHIENNHSHKDTYLVGNSVVLSKDEAVKWILTHRLDGVIIHQENGNIFLRSRPSYSMWNIHMSEELLPQMEGEIDTIMRIVGEKREGQCIWGFINGVWNSKEAALKSALMISKAVQGEQVFSMPNDMLGWAKDVEVCVLLKINIDTPVVKLAAKFFRYLLSLAKQKKSNSPIVVFAHSMGAIISEHALELLSQDEKEQICIYTFGGGSFIAPGKSHPDTHNFVSASDLICLMGSPNLRTLAMQRYLGHKEGLTDDQIIFRLAQEDASLYLDSINPEVIDNYEKQRQKYFKEQFKSISNITIIDSESALEHSFCNNCYQNIVEDIVKRYKKQPNISKDLFSKVIDIALV